MSMVSWKNADQRRAEDPNPVKCMIECEEDLETPVDPQGFGYSSLHRVTIQAWVDVWLSSNPMISSEQKKTAVTTLICEMQGDVLDLLNPLRHYIMDGDREAALKIVSKMQNIITKGKVEG